MNDDILCEAPGPGGMTCTLPYGHGGNKHAFEVQIPPNVAKMIEDHLSMMEEQTKRMRKQERFYTWMKYAWMGMFGLYLVLTVIQAFNR